MSVNQVSEPVARFTADQMLSTALHADIHAQELRSDVTVLSGAGANIVVLDDPGGKVLVDSGFAISRPEVERALSRISPRNVRYLLNTHFHFDHTDGNGWLQEEGATIIAHTQTCLRLSVAQSLPAFRSVRPAAPVNALPTITFDQQMRVQLKTGSILLKRYTPAHTDSDIAVHFEDLDILHTGDTWFNDIYPFIDLDGGGSIDGLLVATRENLELAGPRTLVVPGHGNIGSRDDLLDFYEMLLATRSEVAQLKALGLDADAVIEVRPASQFEAKYGAGLIPYELFIFQVYEGV
jgi:glyoxylase-like metal-dependent hydrolase (beta-lactamase superfamily II)